MEQGLGQGHPGLESCLKKKQKVTKVGFFCVCNLLPKTKKKRIDSDVKRSRIHKF